MCINKWKTTEIWRRNYCLFRTDRGKGSLDFIEKEGHLCDCWSWSKIIYIRVKKYFYVLLQSSPEFYSHCAFHVEFILPKLQSLRSRDIIWAICLGYLVLNGKDRHDLFLHSILQYVGWVFISKWLFISTKYKRYINTLCGLKGCHLF